MRYLKKGEIIRSGDFYKALGGKNKSTFHLVCVEKGYSGAIGSRVGDLLTTVHRPSEKKGGNPFHIRQHSYVSISF